MHKQGFVRFTFDCPENLHTVAKIRAAAFQKSMKDYIIALLIKDAQENPIKMLDNPTFKKELRTLLQDDAELMKKLTDR